MIRSRFLVVICALSFSTAPVFAQTDGLQTDPIGARQKVFKGFAAASKEPGAMLKGDVPFDLAKVQAALKVYAEGSTKLPGLFPENSKTGGNTEALPSIWENMDDFKGRFSKFESSSNAAVVAITDEATFKTEFPKVLANCGGCHKLYRGKN